MKVFVFTKKYLSSAYKNLRTKNKAKLKNYKLLIVDSNSENRFILSSILKSYQTINVTFYNCSGKLGKI